MSSDTTQPKGERGFFWRAGVFATLMMVACGLILGVAYLVQHRDSVFTTGGTAAAISLISGWAAMAAAERLRTPKQVAAPVLAAMFVRFVVVFGAVGAIYLYAAPLVKAGVLYYLIIFYLIALLLETLLALPPKKRPAGGIEKKAASHGNGAD